MSIISDTTVRTLIVKGEKEVERITNLNQGKHMLDISKKEENIYEIKLIYRVGDYMPKGGE